jgi:hypothetical protein
VAHPITIPAWFIRVPANDEVLRWQVSHGVVVGKWFAGLPLAVVPLWQVAQPVVTPVWLKAAPANEVVLLWQVSQAALVVTWPAGLPIAVEPL